MLLCADGISYIVQLSHYYCSGTATSQKPGQIEDASSGDKTKTE